MWCALVYYLVVTIFAIAYSLSEPCVFKDYYWQKRAYCGRENVKYTFDYIPPISQYISYINLEGQSLKQLPYNGFRNLSSQSNISEIKLRDCQINYVDASAFLNLHNLTAIDLSHNDIYQIDSKLLSDTKQLKYISMAYNKIEVLPNGLFQNLISLKQVFLHHNQIRQVEKFSFKNTPSLWLIDLRNNHIELINMLFKDKLDNLTYLSLSGNPWKCNCELGPLYEFIIKINQSYRYPLVCDKPSTLHGRNWSDISRDKFVCRSEVTMVASILNWIPYTISVLVLIGVAAVIIGVVFVVRYTKAKSNTRSLIRLPTLVEQGSDRRTNAWNMYSGIPMRVVHSSAVSENNVSGSSIADVLKNQHHEPVATIS